MTTLYGSAQVGLSEHAPKTDRKYYLRAGSLWLHGSGLKLTEKRSEAWDGTIDQARNCRRDYPAAAGCKAIPAHSIIPTQLNVEA